MSEDQIFTKKFRPPNDWQRVAGKEFLSADQQLLALPTYRPDIAVGAGINLRMLGGTELELLPANAKEPAGIKIRFGRIVAMPLANAGTRLRIIIGKRTGVITFADPEAVVAIDIRRIHTPGANPETEPAPFASEFFVTTGHALWDETGQKTLEIAGPARFTFQDQSPAELAIVQGLSQVDHGRADRHAGSPRLGDYSPIFAGFSAGSARRAGINGIGRTSTKRSPIGWRFDVWDIWVISIPW